MAFPRAGYKKQRGDVITTSPRLDNKPIIITFLAMEKVILLCTVRTRDSAEGLVVNTI